MDYTERVLEHNRQTRDALQTVYDALNAGQKSKILKNETVKKLFEHYHVVIDK